MEIIEYSNEYKEDFISLNKYWIEKYFSIEENDLYVFSHIDDVIQNGGQIFLAKDEGEIKAVCMIEYLGDDVYEIGKLASLQNGQGKGYGEKTFSACIDFAKEKHAKKIILVTNTMLHKAIHIYEKYGFVSAPMESDEFGYSRGNIKFELDL